MCVTKEINVMNPAGLQPGPLRGLLSWHAI